MTKITNEQKWAVGLIEAKGDIGNNKKSGIIIRVSLSQVNARAIYKLKKIIGVGKVHQDSAGMVTYKLTDMEKIKSRVNPLLEKYPFRGEKYYDYQVLKKRIEVAEDPKLTREEKETKLREIKEENRKEVTPVVSKKLEDRGKEAKDVINSKSEEELREIYEPWWLAGYVEGNGSLEINDKLEIVFELAQTRDKTIVIGVHKAYRVPENIEEREGNMKLSTKTPKTIEKIMGDLKGKLLGMKSFEYKLWCYAYKTGKEGKKERAKLVINKLNREQVKNTRNKA